MKLPGFLLHPSPRSRGAGDGVGWRGTGCPRGCMHGGAQPRARLAPSPMGQEGKGPLEAGMGWGIRG